MICTVVSLLLSLSCGLLFLVLLFTFTALYRATAEELLRRGFHVIISVRKREDGDYVKEWADRSHVLLLDNPACG